MINIEIQFRVSSCDKYSNNYSNLKFRLLLFHFIYFSCRFCVCQCTLYTLLCHFCIFFFCSCLLLFLLFFSVIQAKCGIINILSKNKQRMCLHIKFVIFFFFCSRKFYSVTYHSLFYIYLFYIAIWFDGLFFYSSSYFLLLLK